jgi:hypothetical protein
MTLHYCEDGGYVVAADTTVPEDPTDYQAGAAILGCSNLRCTRCDGVVRNRAGIECPKLKTRLKVLSQTDDWTTLEFVKPFGPGRLYACSCVGWLETTYHACGDPAPDVNAGDPSLPWRCAGHPVATLPLVVDGETITATTDFEAFTARVLGGWSPDVAPPPSPWSPSSWLYRVRRRLADLPEAPLLAGAAAACLTDPLRRAGALAYFCGFPRDPGFERVLTLATDPDEMFRRSPTVVKQGPAVEYWPAMALRCRLFSVREDLDALDHIALQLLQGALLRGDARFEEKDIDAIRWLAPSWLADHAGDGARDNPARAIQILESLKELNKPDLVAQAGVAIAKEGAAHQDALRTWLNHWSNRSEAYAPAIAQALGSVPQA